jgi:proteic killer suppression protein
LSRTAILAIIFGQAGVARHLTYRLTSCYIAFVIKSFRDKGLRDLFTTGKSAKIPANLRVRCAQILQLLHAAKNLTDMAIPGLRTHPLTGRNPLRHAVDVNGPWRITFEFRESDAWVVDLEQYH